MQKGQFIAYKSQKLKKVEHGYLTHQKEMTVVVRYLDVWRHYLVGTKFFVYRNNMANTYFTTLKKLPPK